VHGVCVCHTRMSGNACWTPMRVSAKAKQNEGALGITLTDPCLGGEGSGMSVQTLTMRMPWARNFQAVKEKSQGVRVLMTCKRVCRETLLKVVWMSRCRITSAGQQDRPDWSAWFANWLRPGTPTPS
jgi:hypothetical protein